ncbi:hypothetical protein [Sphingomonas oryzagri]|uniref:Uncharacterized protein n=1 Tax=Sphingomonas oryzagri TaxID=3042314 RepID=A0ABT6N5B0_9SPHN|nr:hypothetical protein [Sphingomonas oryzagri]MDH7640303.1 hypothetical protein [Sphingomonas oryzagri]
MALALWAMSHSAVDLGKPVTSLKGVEYAAKAQVSLTHWRGVGEKSVESSFAFFRSFNREFYRQIASFSRFNGFIGVDNFHTQLYQKDNSDRSAKIGYANFEREFSGPSIKPRFSTFNLQSGSFKISERPQVLFRNVGTSFGVVGSAPRENGCCDGGGESKQSHSELRPEQRSPFVRISGLIDRRLGSDTVAGNPWLATGVTWLFCLLGGWGVWRLWNHRWLTGAALVAVMLIGPLALFSVP